MTSQLSNLKIQLKQWEHHFIEEQHREPTKDDIRRLPEVKKMYKQYSALKKESTIEINAKGIPPQNNSSTVSIATPALELGPTPQIHGKAVSIFEMRLSPIKRTDPVNGVRNEPTSTLSPQGGSCSDLEENQDVKRQLIFADTTPNSSPFKKQQAELGPKYYGPNSPFKLTDANIELSIIHRSPYKCTPRKNINDANEMSSFSPSPLVRRPLTKSLLELVQEHEAIVEEFKNMGDEQDLELDRDSNDLSDHAIEEEISQCGPTKSKRRILRRFATNETTKTVKRNISEELIRLKQKHVNEFYGDTIFMENENDDQIEEEHDEKDTKTSKKNPKKRKNKYNLVSNNFRRLRLPKKNSSNRFFGKRRR